ncbi:MAG: sterol desaturase family protein [Bacillota bacterium]|nr:sterol desaturase family protein [Bacillota bacterium]MDP4171426.1 sterol desaturase family protein [Bacillota bacterium]
MFLILLSGLTTILLNGFHASLAFCFFLGMIGFAISEYFTHRFVFHQKAPKNKFLLKLMKRLHYDHHKYPNDLKLLFLPLWYSLPNFLAFAALFYAVHHDLMDTVAFGLGLMGMLLLYEWKHYIAHRPLIPGGRFGRWVKKVHLLHHFKNENYWFGVSTPFLDYAFGTFKDEKQVKTSKTVKNIEKRA